MDEKCVRQWRIKISVLSEQRRAKQARQFGTTQRPKLEEVLLKWVQSLRKNRRSVSSTKNPNCIDTNEH